VRGNTDESNARPRDGDEALTRLREGNARFAADRKLNAGHDLARRAELAAGQDPFAVILGCSDSRVPPEVVFDQGLGELFVVRVAGNTAVDPFVLGSVEFALEHLGCSLVLVLGHQSCGAVEGAVAAAVEGSEETGSIGDVIAPIVPVVERVAEESPGLSTGELAERSVRANVGAALRNLSEGSRLVARLVESGAVTLAGAEYRLPSGEVVLL
jgi:carbonic anhydrase